MQKLQEHGKWVRTRRAMMGDVPRIEMVGIITAQNPNAQRLTNNRNLVLNRQLVAALAEKSCSAEPCGHRGVKGMFGHPEDSFIVPNITSKDLIELGNQFHQQSVIWGHKRYDRQKNPFFTWSYIELNGKDGKVTQNRDVSVSQPDVQSREDFYSAIGSRKFIIPFFDDPYSNYEPEEKYGTIQQRATIPLHQEEPPHREPDSIFGDEPPLRKAESFALWFNRKFFAEKTNNH